MSFSIPRSWSSGNAPSEEGGINFAIKNCIASVLRNFFKIPRVNGQALPGNTNI